MLLLKTIQQLKKICWTAVHSLLTMLSFQIELNGVIWKNYPIVSCFSQMAFLITAKWHLPNIPSNGLNLLCFNRKNMKHTTFKVFCASGQLPYSIDFLPVNLNKYITYHIFFKLWEIVALLLCMLWAKATFQCYLNYFCEFYKITFWDTKTKEFWTTLLRRISYTVYILQGVT